jgi:hypothetical protein
MRGFTTGVRHGLAGTAAALGVIVARAVPGTALATTPAVPTVVASAPTAQVTALAGRAGTLREEPRLPGRRPRRRGRH